MATTTFLDRARPLITKGIRVFPLQAGTKDKQLLHGEGTDGWAGQATTDLAKIIEWDRLWPHANIGAVAGDDHVWLDFDHTDVEPTELFEIALPPTWTVRTGHGWHLKYRVPQPPHDGVTRTSGRIQQAPVVVEIKTGNGYVVGAGSVHPDGHVYTLVHDLPLAELPVPLHRILATAKLSSGARRPGRTDTDTMPLCEMMDGDGRDNRLTSIAGGLRAKGMDEGEVLTHLRTDINTQLKEPLPDRDLSRIARSVARYPDERNTPEAKARRRVVNHLNQTYAFVQIGSGAYAHETLDHGDARYELRTLTTLRAKLMNYRMEGFEGNAASVWLSDPSRREFPNGIVFEPPGIPLTPGSYNLWRGFAIEPKPGDCALLAHIHDNVCSGNPEHARWVLGWLAWIFQRPAEKLGTALALRGVQGSGKSVVGKMVGSLLGDTHYKAVANPADITGRFNSHIEALLLLQAEEAFFAGSKAEASVLKNLITNDTLQIERKGVNAITLPNYTRVMVTSNSEWVVPADSGERRWTVLDVSPQKAQDFGYFRDLWRQMREDGGDRALLHHLLTTELDEPFLRRPLDTDALREQKHRGLPMEDQWLETILETGHLPGDDRGEGVTQTAVLLESFNQFVRERRGRLLNPTAIGIYLAKAVPERQILRTLEDKRRAWEQRWPTLDTVRRCFSQRTGRRDIWDGPAMWVAAQMVRA